MTKRHLQPTSFISTQKKVKEKGKDGGQGYLGEIYKHIRPKATIEGGVEGVMVQEIAHISPD